MKSADLTTRQKQLRLFDGYYVIKQDQELIDLINLNQYTRALGVGEVGYFGQHIDLVDSGTTNFCIYIQNFKFDFDTLIDHVNHIGQNNLEPGGLIYLALNKYMAEPRRYALDLSPDYDTAIEQYIRRKVNLLVENYKSCGSDLGQRFNWVHPLTRFYLRKQS